MLLTSKPSTFNNIRNKFHQQDKFNIDDNDDHYHRDNYHDHDYLDDDHDHDHSIPKASSVILKFECIKY
jgi:hypothetical protein